MFSNKEFDLTPWSIHELKKHQFKRKQCPEEFH